MQPPEALSHLMHSIPTESHSEVLLVSQQIPEVTSWPSGLEEMLTRHDERIGILQTCASKGNSWNSNSHLPEAGQILSESQTIGLKDHGLFPRGNLLLTPIRLISCSGGHKQTSEPLMPQNQVNKLQKHKVNLLPKLSQSFHMEDIITLTLRFWNTLGFKCWLCH